MLSVLECLKELGFSEKDIIVLFFGSSIYRQDYSDIKSFKISLNKKLFFVKPLFLMIWNILRCKYLIYAGGGFLNERQPTLRLLWWMLPIFIGIFLRRKVILFSLGINHAFRNFIFRFWVRHSFNKVELITVRDAISRERLIKIGVNRNKIVETADIVWSYRRNNYLQRIKRDRSEIIRVGLNIIDPYGGYGLRDNEKRKIFLKNLSNSIEDLIYNLQENERVTLGFINTVEIDYNLVEEIKNKNSFILKRVPINYYSKDPRGILETIQKFDIIIATRFHSVVLSILLEKLVIPILYEDKVKSLVNEIGLKDYAVEYDNFEKLMLGILPVQDILRKFNKIIKEREKVMSKIKTEKEKMIKKSELNCKALNSVLRGAILDVENID